MAGPGWHGNPAVISCTGSDVPASEQSHVASNRATSGQIGARGSTPASMRRCSTATASALISQYATPRGHAAGRGVSPGHGSRHAAQRKRKPTDSGEGVDGGQHLRWF